MSLFSKHSIFFVFIFCSCIITVKAQLDNRAVKNFPALGVKVNGIREKVEHARKLLPPPASKTRSVFRDLTIADSFSRHRDSVNAGMHMLKVSPYYLIYLGQTPKTINAYLSKFALTTDTKTGLLEKFTQAYTAKGTEIYTKLRAMYMETTQLKHILDTCPGNLKAYYDKQIQIADSAHFAFLFDYTAKNGWPDIENGALYAGYMAMRDIEHCYDYIPLTYKAYMAGQLPYFMAHTIYENWRYYIDYVIWKEYMKGPYEVFDVSTMLTGEMPATEPSILASVKAHCPVKEIFYVTYSGKRRIDQGAWLVKYGKHFEKSFFEFHDKVFANCPQIHLEQMDRGIGPGIDMLQLPTDYKGERMLFYIFY